MPVDRKKQQDDLDELKSSLAGLNGELDNLAAQGFPLIAMMLRSNIRALCGLRAGEAED